jgi:hypothetical protein
VRKLEQPASPPARTHTKKDFCVSRKKVWTKLFVCAPQNRFVCNKSFYKLLTGFPKSFVACNIASMIH